MGLPVRTVWWPAGMALLGVLLLLSGCTGSDVGSGTSGDDAPDASVGDPVGDASEGKDIPTNVGTPDAGTGTDAVVEPPPPDLVWFDCVDGGEPGCPCDDNSDCFSEYCVTTGDGSVCSKACEADCPDGWKCKDVASTGGDLAYICVPLYTNLCRPCETGADCEQMGGVGGYCLPSAEGSFCGGACDDDTLCPAGYSCDDVVLGDDLSVRQCVPVDGVCECNAKAVKEGASTTCEIANEFGACQGTAACLADGLDPCDALVPGAEVCDGVDNNCDGSIDDVGELSCEVTNDFGTCTGTQTCEAGALTACTAEVPAEDICDGLDNDCDGEADPGSPDLDADGVADCVDTDDDGDGQDDDLDNCPEVANDDQADLDADGLGDACDDDKDGDGLADEEDCDASDPDVTCTIYFLDEDVDGAGLCDVSQCLCEPVDAYTVTVCEETDCNDEEPTVHPGHDELCDGLDNNCNGAVDEGELDLDADGVSDECDLDDDADGVADLEDNCPAEPNADQSDWDDDGEGDVCDLDDDGDGVADEDDCAPEDPSIYPGAFDTCNLVNDDCDDETDEDCSYQMPTGTFAAGFVHGATDGQFVVTQELGLRWAVGETGNTEYEVQPFAPEPDAGEPPADDAPEDP